MATSMGAYEEAIAPVKNKLFQQISAAASKGPVDVLEIGMGTGPNLKFYGNEATRVTALDPNAAMVPYATEAAAQAGITSLDFVTAAAEDAPFPNSSFDFVVSTLTLCSVASPQATLSQIKRVLKPGGVFVFVEHVIAPSPGLLRTSQRVLDPLQQLVAGCHLTRETGQVIEDAGFESVDLMRFSVEGKGVALISPHVAGSARVGVDAS